MTDFKKIALAKKNNDKTQLFESSLGRIWYHVQDSQNKSFAILTSWRHSQNKNDNLKDFTTLRNNLRTAGYGFVIAKGHWKECQDPDQSYDQCPPDQLVDSKEPSLFVPGISKEEAVKLADKFKQDAIVFGGPETDGTVKLLFRDGNEMEIGKLKPQTLGQAFTELRKSKESKKEYFKFEGLEYNSQNFIESLIESTINDML